MPPRGEIRPGHGEVHVGATGVKSICWWGAATALNHNKISFGRDVPECCRAETAAQPSAMAESREGAEGRGSRARTSQASGRGAGREGRTSIEARALSQPRQKGSGRAGPGRAQGAVCPRCSDREDA